MNEKLKSADVNNLFHAILSLKDLNECYDLFEDLCTVAEIKEMAKRFRAAKMLSDGAKYTEISEIHRPFDRHHQPCQPSLEIRHGRLYEAACENRL